MAARERLQEFYGDRRKVYAAISLGPDNWMFAACEAPGNRYYAVMVHESVVRGREQMRGGLVEEEYDSLEEAFVSANRWYRKEATRDLG